MARADKRFRESARSGESELSEQEKQGLCEKLQSIPAQGKIVEIGTAAGGTLAAMWQAVGEKDESRFLVVDTFDYFPDHRNLWEANLRRLGIRVEAVEVMVGRSSHVRGPFGARGQSCAFILVDGGHKLKDVIRDTLWLEFLEIDGLAAFHDYTEKFPGVCRAIDVFLARNPEFKIEDRVGSLLFIRKTRPVSGPLLPYWIVARMTVESVLGQWKKSLIKRLPGGRRCR